MLKVTKLLRMDACVVDMVPLHPTCDDDDDDNGIDDVW